MSVLRGLILKQTKFLLASNNSVTKGFDKFDGVTTDKEVTIYSQIKPYSSVVTSRAGPFLKGDKPLLLPNHPASVAASKGLSLSVLNMATGTDSVDLKAEHEPQNNRFIVRIGQSTGVLEYNEIHHGVLDLYHTEVPSRLRGKSIGQILAKAAFNYVVERDLKMKLSCTYLQDYFIKHPDEKYRQHMYTTDELS